ncbi:homeobox protein 2-like [Contarinia nasturtii]|uniref:homeobox protein 2-like n=1 Tax=Contarinia nasturtii TaxID=265458 RepID=UPI0012D4049F|nr:homeobox protein 2-like [Contarinia nasturtii]
MSGQQVNSEKVKSRIEKLIQERTLLIGRLSSLRKDKNPYIVTREHKAHEKHVTDIEKRLNQIDFELRKERHFLSRQSIIDSEITNNQETEERNKKLSNLEEFINKSIEFEDNLNKMFTTPPKKVTENPITTTSENIPPSNPIPTTADMRGARGLTTSHPVATTSTTSTQEGQDECGMYGIHSTPTTSSNLAPLFGQFINSRPRLSTIVGDPPRYEFPPNYENATEREIRLLKEKQDRERLNKDMGILQGIYPTIGQRSTGTIRKNYMATNTQGHFPNIPEEELLPHQKTFTAQNTQYPNSDEFYNHVHNSELQRQKNLSIYKDNTIEGSLHEPKQVNFENEINDNNFNKYGPIQRNFSSTNRIYNHPTNSELPHRVSRSYNNTPIFDENVIPRDINYNRNLYPNDYQQRIPFRDITPREHSYRDANGVRETYLKRLKHIPKFNGDSFNELKEFINKADTLYRYASNDIEEDEFYEQMIFQLGEEPKNVIINLENPDWNTVKRKLLSYYSYLANKDLLASQIENLHQEKNESILKYSERARKLLKEHNSTYSNLSEDQRREHNKRALRAFSRGLYDHKLKEKLSIRGSDTLENSIAYALEAESESLRDIPNYELFCRFCQINGHRERDCKRKNNDANNLGNLTSALRSLNFPNINNNRNRPRNNFLRGYNFGNGRFGNNRFNSNRQFNPRNNGYRFYPGTRNWNNNGNQYNRNPINNDTSNFNNGYSNNGNFGNGYNNNGNSNLGNGNFGNRNGNQGGNSNRPHFNNNTANRGNYRNDRFSPNERQRSNNFARIFDTNVENINCNQENFTQGNA